MPIDKHILIILPDGVGIKNYLHSKIISYLKENSKITIWSPLPIEAFIEIKDIHKLEFQYKQILLTPEQTIARLYREAVAYARLKHNTKLKDNPTILSTNWRIKKNSFKARLLYNLAQILGNYLTKNYPRILKYEKKAIENTSSLSIKKYTSDLKALQPTSIFITHQRVAGLMPICIAAKNLNIRTATAIFSWDNLPKARLNVKTDQYFVWSQWMKDEMKDYYPEIPQEQVKILGTPQFEFYSDKERLLERNVFAKQHGLDPQKKWICFSGDDKLTSPHDNIFLSDVAEALVTEKQEIQIIFRRCPVDFSERYDEVLRTYNDFIVAIDPEWNIETETGWTGYFPKYIDVNMQINLVHHCELVINLGSTMAVDFATFNKPCLYLNYDPKKDNTWSTKVIYSYQHFKSMEGFDAVGWINNKDTIKETVLGAIDQPQSIAKERQEWIKRIVLHPIDKNSENIAKALL
ncbi:hypothetical protein [Winogradskyella sp.]|uniref:hypothetical protein n=1 Tax=Winogradskyella sp. TaxID=1883156 RepID=UPI0026137CB5|nr:hypothetical protein [Winogradskyella sp.]